MKKRRLWLSALFGIVSVAAILEAQNAQFVPGTSLYPSSTDRGNQLISIGCVQRSGPNTSGTAGNAAFIINDSRGGSYRLDGDQNMLSFHVNHQVEIRGSLMEPETRTTAAKLKVQSILYISPTCWKK